MSMNPLRNIPSVNEMLENPTLTSLIDRISHNTVVTTVRTVLDDLRNEIQDAAATKTIPSVTELAERIASLVMASEHTSLRPVINATGELLPTGLGRAPLAEQAIEEMAAVARDYASVELDLDSGKHSRRTRAIEGLLTELTGAEAACVVNNNAGATMLALAALSSDREVIVSRGQLIELGCSFRLPEAIAASGAVLREVGTTNKTHARDYADAIGESTGVMMLVHPSNYAMAGFTKSVDLKDLVAIGREHHTPVIHDVGTGAILDPTTFGIAGEPVVSESIRAGADLVLFSGDELLGGPQCGILVGRRDLMRRVEQHPLARALRVGKLTLAALGATLRTLRDPDKARREIPLLHLMATSVDNLRNRAERIAPQMAAADSIARAEVIDGTAHLGGSSVPGWAVPTCAIALTADKLSADRLAGALRSAVTPVIARVVDDRVILDLRSVMPRQDQQLIEAVVAIED